MKLSEKGEAAVCRYLKSLGYQILERNYRCRLGEIDIIAMDGSTLCFVEVKTRTTLQYGMPCEAVNQIKQHHIRRTISYYRMLHTVENLDLRIDVAEVLLVNGTFHIHYIKSAFY